MDNELLVKSIKMLCKNNNILLSQLESELGFPPGSISRWARNTPSIDKIVSIADYFNISIDDVVGRDLRKNQFIEKIIKYTQSNELIWNSFDLQENTKVEEYRRNQHIFDQQYNERIYTEQSYFTQYQNGYISIYGFYAYQEIYHPKELKLFVQSDDKSLAIEQRNCEFNDLIPIWLEVLRQLGNVSDEIKAEEFKNDFINTPENLNNEKIEDFLSDPSILKLIETVDTKEFQKVRETLENPEFKSAMRMLNSLQSYLDKRK